jgi:hypothetical protein
MLNMVSDQPAEQKLPDVVPKVAEAMDKLVTFGIPYLADTARRLASKERTSRHEGQE